VNADVIAEEKGLSDIAAGRVTLQRLTELSRQRRDMAFETTGEPPPASPHSGYAARRLLHLIFFWLPNANMAVRRVALRVASGGHSIPEDVIRRRFERGLENFFNAYSPIADSWLLMDNTAPPGRPIAWRDVGELVRVEDNALWSQLVAQYMKPRVEQQPARAVPAKLWSSEDLVKAINEAVTEALRRHKARGESVVIWRDGRIVTLKPEEIDV
jgi:predicted ABC-type ATPase